MLCRVICNRHFTVTIRPSAHCIVNHHTTLYTTLYSHPPHNTALPYTSLHCTTLCSSSLDCTALHFNTLHCTALYSTSLNCTALHYTTVHCPTLNSTSLRFTVIHPCTQVNTVLGVAGSQVGEQHGHCPS